MFTTDTVADNILLAHSRVPAGQWAVAYLPGIRLCQLITSSDAVAHVQSRTYLHNLLKANLRQFYDLVNLSTY